MDNYSIKKSATYFKTKDGGYETLPKNPGIYKFTISSNIYLMSIAFFTNYAMLVPLSLPRSSSL